MTSCRDIGKRVFQSSLPGIAGAATTDGDAYWVYVGYFPRGITLSFVRFTVTAGGASTQTAEVALASSDSAPNCAAQTLTKIAANGTLTDLTGTGGAKNTVSMAAAIPAGTHLWAGLRTSMASTEPSVYGLTADGDSGAVLKTASAGALTGAGPWTGALITAVGTWQAPALKVTQD